MHTSFYASRRVELFFPIFDANSTTGIVLASFIFLLLTMSYEGFKCLRVIISKRDGPRKQGVPFLSRIHAIQTFLHTSEVVFSYILMLAVMSYNIWMLIAVVSGSLIGFLVCHSIKQRLDSKLRSGKENDTCLRKNGEANEDSDDDNDIKDTIDKCHQDCDTKKEPLSSALSSV